MVLSINLCYYMLGIFYHDNVYYNAILDDDQNHVWIIRRFNFFNYWLRLR